MSTAEFLRNSSILSTSDAPNIHELEQEATDELARLNQQLFQLQFEMVEVPGAQLGDKMAHMAALESQILAQRLKQREATVKRLQADLFAKQEMSLDDRTAEQREVLKQEVSEIRRRILRTKTRIKKDCMQNSPTGTAEEMHCGMRTPNLDPSEPGSIATCYTAMEEEESDDGGQMPAEDSHDERFFAVDDDDSEVSQLQRSLRDERQRADRLQIERDEAVNDCKKLQKELKSRRPRRVSLGEILSESEGRGNGPTETQQLHDEISRLQKQVEHLRETKCKNNG